MSNVYVEQVVKLTKNATEAIFDSARRMPEDKLNWKPLDEGRSALEQLREVAMSPVWFGPILEKQSMPEFSEEEQAQGQKLMESWNSIDDCYQACKANSQTLYEVILKTSESDFDKSIYLPFGGDKGINATVAEIAMFQYWNLTYHWGQINYIQTMYGDKEML